MQSSNIKATSLITDALVVGSSLSTGKYIIKQIKGQGGFGITYFASFPSLGTYVAIKECFLNKYCKRVNDKSVSAALPKYEDVFRKYRDKFLEEAKNIASCKHPSIIKITDFFEENNTAYYVMEYIDGVTLQELVTSKLALSEADSILFTKQIAEALQIVHNKNLVHRDVKPSNIMIRNNSDAILIDFGAARDIIDSTAEHTIILTEGFAPPEQYQKDGQKGYHIDLYAIGATLYYCLTGKIPLSAQLRASSALQPPSNINPSISNSLSSIVMKAIELDISNRHPKISTFLYELTTSAAFDPHSRPKLTDSQKSAKSNLEEFIADSTVQAFVLSGPVYSGKTHLIHELIELISKNNRHYHILSIGSRIAESIRNNSRLSNITSIYSLIYDFDAPLKTNEKPSTEQDDDMEKVNFGLRRNDDADNVVYIIDEAQLLSDLRFEDEIVVFGSGKPLQDFMQYANFKNCPNRKVIFIGDDKQILRGGEEEAAMAKSHLESLYSIQTKYYEITETVIEPEYNPILNEALKIRNSISNGMFNKFRIETKEDKIIEVPVNLFRDYYSITANNQNSVIISYTNKQALQYNMQARDILGNTGILKAGDKIITHNRFLADPSSSFHAINAGEFGTVISVENKPNSFTQNIRKKGPVELIFWKAVVLFPRTGITASILILENFLLSESTKLSTVQQIALKIRAKENLKQKQTELGGSALASPLSQDEYTNTALIKYSYAMTCHKAQGIKWENVFIDFESDQGKTNKNYFSWSYTAITRAKFKTFTINAPKISPFSELVWRDNTNTIDSNYSVAPLQVQEDLSTVLETDALRYNFPADKPFLKQFWAKAEEKLQKAGIVIEKIEHKLYQELYHFSASAGLRGNILFHYNGKGIFTNKALQPNSTFTQKIVELLDANDSTAKIYECAMPADFSHEFLKDFYFLLKDGLKGINAVVYSHAQAQYQEKYTICRTPEVIDIVVYYNEQGFVTSVFSTKYNSETLLSEVKNLIISLKPTS